MKNKIAANIVVGFGGQLIVLILGIIIPRVMITNYGSDINGLISTVTQIFTYMALLEAGIGQAARNALYKPIIEKNQKGISFVASVARNYFRKLTIVYGMGVVLLAIVAPFILKSDVEKIVISLVVLFQGLAGVISFYFIQTQTIILGADGRGYINNGINVINQMLSYSARIILAYLGMNIVFLQLIYLLITVAKVFVYQYYFSSKYHWIDYKCAPKEEKFKDRNAYIITEIAWTIFSSTDMIVLSAFVSTQLSSVYGIYNMVFSNITLLVNAVFSSVSYLLGYTYHKNLEKYSMIHDSFNSLFLGVITVLMSVCYVLTIPFVSLYTQGVTDANYIYSSLPLMFCLIQLISWSRYVSGQLTGIAGYAKQTSYVSLIEALTNLSLSIIFVRKFGIVGVTVATVIALPMKVIWCTYIADKKIMKRSYKQSLSIVGINFLFFFSVVLFSNKYQLSISSYGQFFIWGIMLTILFGVIGMGLNFLVNRDCWKVIRRYIIKR